MSNDKLDALLTDLEHRNSMCEPDCVECRSIVAIRELRVELEESNRLNEEHMAENDESGAAMSALRMELTALKAKYCPEEMTNNQKSAWLDMQWEAANPDRLRPERKEWLAKIERYAKNLRRT